MKASDRSHSCRITTPTFAASLNELNLHCINATSLFLQSCKTVAMWFGCMIFVQV